VKHNRIDNTANVCYNDKYHKVNANRGVMMARKLFLLVISVLVATVGNSAILSATDEPLVTGISSRGIVNTVPLPEPELESKPVAVEAPSAPMAGSNTVIVNTVNQVIPVAHVIENYTVTYQVSSAKEYNALANNLSYADIYKFRKMIYGHNSANLLLSLSYKNEGDVITVTEGGVATQYRIMRKHEMVKISDNDLQDILTGQIYAMKDISWALNAYDLALETCLGYGDTPYRWVLFANKV
jgi:hypothetical protein